MNGATIPPPTFFDKLRKICAMFSSPFDGERANAALLADRYVRNAGLRWPDIIKPPQIKAPRPEMTWQMKVAHCLEHDELLSEWERGFLQSIRRRWSLTDKQQRVLERLAARAGVA